MELGPESVLLTRRKAIVTGAARGIGRSTALALARFGAEVAVCDRLEDELDDTVTMLRSLGSEGPVGVLDVRDTDAVSDWVGSIESEWGALHILVNNAGGGFFSDVVDVSAKGQAALIAENFTQVVDVTRACVPMLSIGAANDPMDGTIEDVRGRESVGSTFGGSSIINITSVEAHRAGPGFGIYSAMKAAVANITRTLALELSQHRIRVNAIAPDMIPTPGDASLTADSGALSETSWAPTPWPEVGHPDDVAAAAIWLAGPTSRFVTGSTIHVDGGTFASSGWKRLEGEGGWVL
ncbi:MAG TPA: SDR family oxidoreductase [Microthrixaceae bacterium]|nr:SDR family oxidoreductase [Microthrixaceae bacterium]